MPSDLLGRFRDAINPHVTSATNWLAEHPDVGSTLAGAGIGGVLAGGASATTPSSAGESPSERRKRILRDALVGSAFGAGAGFALPTAIDAFANAEPPASPLEKKVEALTNEFRGNKFLAGAGGAALGGSTPVVASKLLARRDANKAWDHSIKAEADNWQTNWRKSTDTMNAWKADIMKKTWDSVHTTHAGGKHMMSLPNESPAQFQQRKSNFLQQEQQKLLKANYGVTNLDQAHAEHTKHYQAPLDELRSRWGNVAIPGAPAPVSGWRTKLPSWLGGVAPQSGLDRLMAEAATQARAANPQATTAEIEQMFRQNLLKHIQADAHSTGGASTLQKLMESRKGYTGPTTRPGLKPMSWGAKGLGVGLAGAGILAPLAAHSAAQLWQTYRHSTQ